MSLWHVTLATENRQLLVRPEESIRCAVVRTLIRVVGDSLLLFSVVDDHVHLVADKEKAEIGQFGRAIRLALRPLAANPIDAARPRPVENRRHLITLVEYALVQKDHHGIQPVPAISDAGSCFQDLVGARRIPGFKPVLYDHLPRWSRADVYRLAGAAPVPPVTPEKVRELGVSRLVAASARACGLPLPLTGRSDQAVTARRMVVHIGLESGFPAPELARFLGITREGVYRARHQPLPDDLVLAPRLRLALEEWRTPALGRRV